MKLLSLFALCFSLTISIVMAENWTQLQGDPLRSGNAVDRDIPDRLGLIGAIPLSDGIYAAPVVSTGMIHVLDGSGVVFGIDAATLDVKWKFATAGGPGNCNNVSSPAVIGDYVHVGTMSGYYYVLDRQTGSVVRKIDCREAIFSSPVAGADRVYFATLGAQIYAVEPNGTLVWSWDFVKEIIGFNGDRWKGDDWLKARPKRVTWRDHFVCSRELCLIGKTLVIPAGGRTVFLDDAGSSAVLRVAAEIPDYDGKEFPATFGQSADADGNVYVQWHRRDNAGRVEVLKLGSDNAVKTDFIKGTQTAIQLPGLLSFAAVSVRNKDVFRTRPEQGLGLCRHSIGKDEPDVLSEAPSICAPVVTRRHVVYGGLDGNLYAVPLSGGETQKLPTAFGSPITASVAIADGRIYVPSEDGYLYVYGEGGKASLPTRDLAINRIRSPLNGPFADTKFDWYTNYGNFGSTNANDQGLRPPLRMRCASVGRNRQASSGLRRRSTLYPHRGRANYRLRTRHGSNPMASSLAGRLSIVHFTVVYRWQVARSASWHQAIPHAMPRCRDWHITLGSPIHGIAKLERQFPPVVHGNIAIYASGSGQYANQGTEKPFIFKGTPAESKDGAEVMSWIYSNDNPYYPHDNRPLLWAWDLDTGNLVWQKDFSEFGRGGNDCGLCLMDGKLFYSTFFGYSASQRQRRGLTVENNGLTACLDPLTGETLWHTTDYYVTAKCTLSGRDGRLYIGGNNRPNELTDERFVWCLDAKDGSLVWKSDPITSALNVVSVGEKFIFSNALRGRGNVFERGTGKVIGGVDHNYACCRFTLSEPYILGANMDMIDLSNDSVLVSTGPAIDSRECLGAVVSNGRIFYTSQASGFIVSQTFGEEAKNQPAVWVR